jgi:hypothetical protein
MILRALLIAGLVLQIPGPTATGVLPRNAASLLRKIHREIKDVGPLPGENFIHWEFFIGGEDDDDTNKNGSVVALIQDDGGTDKILLQVTTMEGRRGEGHVLFAGETKRISAVLSNGEFRLLRSDYAEHELTPLFTEMLDAILKKKKLMEGIRRRSHPAVLVPQTNSEQIGTMARK